jgi:hypothetical protein
LIYTPQELSVAVIDASLECPSHDRRFTFKELTNTPRDWYKAFMPDMTQEKIMGNCFTIEFEVLTFLLQRFFRSLSISLKRTLIPSKRNLSTYLVKNSLSTWKWPARSISKQQTAKLEDRHHRMRTREIEQKLNLMNLKARMHRNVKSNRLSSFQLQKSVLS